MTSTEVDETEFRIIDAGPPPTRFARGWHCIGLIRDFKDGKPHSIEAFGTKLVVFADSKGELNVLDAYCRHMGGDLSQGEIKGDTIACPFHDWRWNGSGKCTSIPYARRVPPVAKTRAWTTMEQDDLLFVWNNPEGDPPPPGVTIPVIKTADAEWTDWVWKTFVIDTNSREIIDNVVDMAHFFYVHKSFPTYFKNVFEDHVAVQYFRGESREDIRPKITDGSAPNLVATHSDAAYYGPSFMIDVLDYEYETGTVNSVLTTCHYPVSANQFVLMSGITVKKTGYTPDGSDAADFARKHSEFIAYGFEEDVKIWKNKSRINNPLLCEEDGPVYQLRRWYGQFYVNVADVTPDMVARFEFEMDTSKAVEAWRAEVRENIARSKATNSPV